MKICTKHKIIFIKYLFVSFALNGYSKTLSSILNIFQLSANKDLNVRKK
jgi:hypothetical protein